MIIWSGGYARFVVKSCNIIKSKKKKTNIWVISVSRVVIPTYGLAGFFLIESPCIERYTRPRQVDIITSETPAPVSESLTGGSRSGSGGIYEYRRGNTWQGKVHVIQWSFLEFFSCFYAHTNSHNWEEANDDWLCTPDRGKSASATGSDNTTAKRVSQRFPRSARNDNIAVMSYNNIETRASRAKYIILLLYYTV